MIFLDRKILTLLGTLLIVKLFAQTNKPIVANDSLDIIEKSEYSSFIPAYELYKGFWDNNLIFSYRNESADIEDKIINLVDDEHVFTMPVIGEVISEYGYRGHRMHTGIDIRLNLGDTVYNTFDGRVRYTKPTGGYGKMIIIRHFNGLETVYAHLSSVLVEPNQYVASGTPIGLGGRTGRATTYHLHFETRYLNIPFNPRDIIDFEIGTLKSKYLILSKNNFYIYNSYTNQKKSYTTNRKTLFYTVKKGDNLSKIAKKYNISLQQLCKINGIKPTTKIFPGNTIIIRNDYNEEQIKTSDSLYIKNDTSILYTYEKKDSLKHKSISYPNATNKSDNIQDNEITKLYIIKKGDNISKIAKENNLSIKDLCYYNNINKNTILKIGDTIYLTEKSKQNIKKSIITEKIINDSTNKISNDKTSFSYIVKKGDNLYNIAKKHSTTPQKIAEINDFPINTKLKIAQKILIPYDNYDYKKEESKKQKKDGKTIIHKIKKGDNLYNIAKRYNIPLKELILKNNIQETDVLKIGQEIIIPIK